MTQAVQHLATTDAPAPSRADATAHAGDGGTGRPSAGRYALDPTRTSVTFRTRHLFGLGTVSGRVALVGGSLVLPGAGDGLELTATVDASSFDTANRSRDRVVRSTRFLDTVQHPLMTVSAERWSAQPSDDRAAALEGRLTVRGTAAPVLLDLVLLEQTSSEVRFRATATVDRYAHGVSAAKGLSDRYVQVTVVGTAVRELP